MAFTEKFRQQHDEILTLATAISAQLGRPEPDPLALRKLLSQLAGKVTFHLAMEDNALYPRLMNSGDWATERLAHRFLSEMGGLARVFLEYNQRWQGSAIRADLPGFAEETRKVFGALAHRIARENEELYPLADADRPPSPGAGFKPPRPVSS